MHIDHSKIEGLLRDASEKKILPRWRNLKEQEIDEKSPGEVVTPADRACEAYLQQQLPRILPRSVVIGEESVHENARSRQKDDMGAVVIFSPLWTLPPFLNFLCSHFRNPQNKQNINSVGDVLAIQAHLRMPAFIIARKQGEFWKITEKIFPEELQT